MGRVEAVTMERRSWRNFAREEKEIVGIKCLSTHLNFRLERTVKSSMSNAQFTIHF
jgi:hypothetical protein